MMRISDKNGSAIFPSSSLTLRGSVHCFQEATPDQKQTPAPVVKPEPALHPARAFVLSAFKRLLQSVAVVPAMLRSRNTAVPPAEPWRSRMFRPAGKTPVSQSPPTTFVVTSMQSVPASVGSFSD
jgi:hypothetical protein